MARTIKATPTVLMQEPVVAEQSKALTDELNHLYGQLHKLKKIMLKHL